MGNVIELFTSFSGRINRASWWLGYVVYVILSGIGTVLLNPTALSMDPDVEVPGVWSETIWQLVLIIPLTAIVVKRFNDRDWPHWLGYAIALIAALLYLAPHFGFFTFGPDKSVDEGIAILVLAIPLVFAFIDNGFLRGTKGPNRYGPDPLQNA